MNKGSCTLFHSAFPLLLYKCLAPLCVHWGSSGPTHLQQTPPLPHHKNSQTPATEHCQWCQWTHPQLRKCTVQITSQYLCSSGCCGIWEGDLLDLTCYFLFLFAFKHGLHHFSHAFFYTSVIIQWRALTYWPSSIKVVTFFSSGQCSFTHRLISLSQNCFWGQTPTKTNI